MKLKFNFEFIAYLFLSVLVSCVGFYYCRNTKYFLNGDSLSYLSTAKLYATGQWWNAVNSYWSPLFSWVLAVLMYLNIDTLYFGKIILCVSIIPTLFLIKHISGFIGINKILNFSLSVTVAFILLQDAVFNFTPDLLFIPCMLYVLYYVLKEFANPFTSNTNILVAVSAIGFYTKQYMLFYFSALMFVLFIYQFAFHPNQSKQATTSFLKRIGFFFLLILPWVILISVKENKITFSTASNYNINQLSNPQQPVLSYLENGLLPLPYPEAYSYWASPSKIPMTEYSMIDGYKNLSLIKFQLHRINENYFTFFDFINFILGYQGLLILLIAAIICIYHLSKPKSSTTIYLLLLMSMIIYSTGYILLVADYRYIYFDIVLLVLIAAKILNDALPQHLPKWILIISGASFFYLFGKVSSDKINEYYTAGKLKTESLNIISKLLNRNSNTCNYNFNDEPYDLVYKNNLHFFGKLKTEQSLNYKLQELNQYNIKYIFAQTAITDSLAEFLSPVILNSEGLWIYTVNK